MNGKGAGKYTIKKYTIKYVDSVLRDNGYTLVRNKKDYIYNTLVRNKKHYIYKDDKGHTLAILIKF